jgi:hypothetical protein
MENPTPEPTARRGTAESRRGSHRGDRGAGARARAGHHTAVRTAKLEPAFADAARRHGKTLDEARAAIFAKMAEAEEQAETRNTHVVFGEDAREKWLRGATNWLIVRSGLGSHRGQAREGIKESEMNPGEFRGLSLLDLARQVASSRRAARSAAWTRCA